MEEKKETKEMFLHCKKAWLETFLIDLGERTIPQQQLWSSICLTFFFLPTFSRWWEERLDLAIISILPQEMFKVLINTYLFYSQKNVQENCLEVCDENHILPINRKEELFHFQLYVRRCASF